MNHAVPQSRVEPGLGSEYDWSLHRSAHSDQRCHSKSRLIDVSHAQQRQDLALELAQLRREDHGRLLADS
jgi:hypothetical protein